MTSNLAATKSMCIRWVIVARTPFQKMVIIDPATPIFFTYCLKVIIKAICCERIKCLRVRTVCLTSAPMGPNSVI